MAFFLVFECLLRLRLLLILLSHPCLLSCPFSIDCSRYALRRLREPLKSPFFVDFLDFFDFEFLSLLVGFCWSRLVWRFLRVRFGPLCVYLLGFEGFEDEFPVRFSLLF